MSTKVAKILIWVFYLLGLLIVFLADKSQLEDQGVRLYANQMIILLIASIALCWTVVVPLAVVVFWVMGLINIIQDKDQPLPLIGNWNWFFK